MPLPENDSPLISAAELEAILSEFLEPNVLVGLVSDEQRLVEQSPII